MKARERVAEVRYSVDTPSGRPIVEVYVAKGTRLIDTLKAQDILARELLPKISPVGCDVCISGVDFFVREHLEQVIRVDLDAGRIIG